MTLSTVSFHTTSTQSGRSASHLSAQILWHPKRIRFAQLQLRIVTSRKRRVRQLPKVLPSSKRNVAGSFETS